METDNESTDAQKTAGSPVLGSSTFKRKFLKSKCSRRRSKLRLSDKFEDEILFTDRPSSAVKSSNSTCVSTSHIDQLVDKHTVLNENELAMKKCSLYTNVLSIKEPHKAAGFQTASGKPIFNNEDSSEFANKLMSEFFNPLVVPVAEKKYSFLSKRNLRSGSVKSENASNFLGFEDKEYRCALKLVENIHDIICIISSSKSSECSFNVQHSTNLSENDILKLYINDNLYSNNTKNTHNSSEKIDSNENIESNIDARSVKIKEEINTPRLIFGSDIQTSVETVPQSWSTSEACLENGIFREKKREMTCNVEVNIPQFATASGKKIEIPSNKLDKVHSIFKDIADFPDNLALNSMSSQLSNTGRIYSSSNPEENLKSNAIGHSYSINRLEKNTVKSTLDPKQAKTNAPAINSILTTEKSCKKIAPQFPRTSGEAIAPLLGIDEIFENIPCFSDMKTKSTKNSAEEFTSLFSTASGKSIKLPSTNLSGIDKIFEDIQGFSHIKMNLNMKCTEEISSLFSTASGKSIKIPSSTITGIDKIFKDIPNLNNINMNSKGFTPPRINNVSIDIPDLPQKELNAATKNEITPLKNYSSDTGERIIKQETDVKIDGDNDNTNYITPQRTLPKKRRLGSSLSKSGKIPEIALNRAKSLFGDMNFDDLKLPSHLKCGSPTLKEVSFTPKKSNQISTPQFFSTPLRTITKNESFLNDVPQGNNQKFVIQKPKLGNLKDMEEELSRQRGILERKLEIVVKKQEVIRMQMSTDSLNKRCKFEPQAKKNKMHLTDLRKLEVQSHCAVPTNSIVLQVNPQNAVLIHFNNNWHEVPTVTTEDGCTLVPNLQGLIGIAEIEPAFCSMPSIDKKLIPEGWIRNHYRWIVWKLASYERFFPATLGGCFNIDNVIKQLKYRYFKELYNVERPALRKIYEKDDIPQKKMILCISNIIKNGDNTELELTDGWYSIRAIVDDPLCHQINNRKIKIGTKLIISGAEILNCEGCHPLELDQAQKVRLKINFNATRRATWFSKLGYQRDPSPLFIKLSSAVWNGGNIGRIKFFIMRIYPVIYREKTEASVFWRNQNAEYKKIQEYENECLKKYEEDSNVNIVRRNVCSLLQMTVIDVSDDIPQPFKCTIWESTDSHQEQLKENQVVICYNLTLRCNGELSCTKKTYFQVSKHDTRKYEKYRRKCVELDSYQIMLDNAVFGEFDTIGYIVKMHIEQSSQYFWLTDLKNNFLLVKINEGPNHCLLLNKVEEGDLVAVCNLTLNSSKGTFNIATAGSQTIITQYPQYDFLRKKMELLEIKNRDEIQSILRSNRKTIDNLENGNKAEITIHSSNSEGNSLNFSRVTSTDAVMSMINIDEIVSKHTM